MWTVFWRTVFCNVFVVTNRKPRELMGDMGLCTLTRDSHHNSSASSTLVAVGAFHDVSSVLVLLQANDRIVLLSERWTDPTS